MGNRYVPVPVVHFRRVPVEQRVANQFAVERNRQGKSLLVRIASPYRAKEAPAGVLRRSQALPVDPHEIEKFVAAGKPVANEGIDVFGSKVAQRRDTSRHVQRRMHGGLVLILADGHSQRTAKMVCSYRQSLAKIKTMRSFSLDARIQVQLSTAIRFRFGFQPIE